MEKTKGKPKLNYRNTFLIGFGFLASSLPWSLYNSFVPLLLEERFLSSTALIGMIMTIDNFFGVIFQPVVGALSDRVDTRYGKRMPWIMIGLPICAILFIFIPRMSTLKTTMIVLIIFNLIMSLWRSPVISLMPDVTAPSLRSAANGIINFMGGVGAIIAFLVGGKLASSSGGLNMPFLMGAVVMLLSLLLLLGFVREPAMLRYRKRHGIPLNAREQELYAQYERDVPETEEEKTHAEEGSGKIFGKKVKAFSALDSAEKRSLIFFASGNFSLVLRL